MSAPHDWRWGEIASSAVLDSPRKPIVVCWRCDAVCWNEHDFTAACVGDCAGYSDSQILAGVKVLLQHPPRSVNDGDDLLALIRDAIWIPDADEPFDERDFPNYREPSP